MHHPVSDVVARAARDATDESVDPATYLDHGDQSDHVAARVLAELRAEHRHPDDLVADLVAARRAIYALMYGAEDQPPGAGETLPIEEVTRVAQETYERLDDRIARRTTALTTS